MRKLLFVLIFFSGILIPKLTASDDININFKDLKIMDFIKITSKITNKNILITQEIDGNVNFVSNKPVNKNELIKILNYVLEDKGYTLVLLNNIYRIVKLEKQIILPETAIGFSKDIPTKKDTKIFYLKNIEAINVIKILDSIISKNIYDNPNLKPIISLDDELNALIVKASYEDMNDIKILIEELDKEKAQVYVQAKIIEVNDEMVDKIGISYGVFGGAVGSNGLATFSSSLNGGSDSIFVVPDTIGLKIPDIKSGLALGATLNLLKQNGALDIVSEPSILAINNKESSIYVGEKISIKISSSETVSGNERTNFQREDVGLTLKVKPRISNEDKVTLEINTILEAIKTTQTKSGNADTLKKEIKTTAILNNGESVIIGGLIENKVESTNQKVPILGDVPLFGELFKNEVINSKKNNLVIIVTPYMVPKAKDITYVRNNLAQLKNLENRYLENSLLKLKEEKSLGKKDTKKDENETFNEESNSNSLEPQKRVSDILGY